MPLAKRDLAVGIHGGECKLCRLGTSEKIVGQYERPATKDCDPRECAEGAAAREACEFCVRFGFFWMERPRAREEYAGVGSRGGEESNSTKPDHPAQLRARMRQREHTRAHHLPHHDHRSARPAREAQLALERRGRAGSRRLVGEDLARLDPQDRARRQALQHQPVTSHTTRQLRRAAHRARDAAGVPRILVLVLRGRPIPLEYWHVLPPHLM
eukprot:scaffold323552_cov32-Tisochrysis_lutea.AAC.1